MNPSLAESADRDIIQRALAGQQACYAELMRRYRDTVYRQIRAQVGDADEAFDLTQEAFIAAFSNLARFDLERPFRLWISRIAINKCRDWARRRAVRRFFTFAKPIDEALDIADTARTPEEHLAAAEETDRLNDAISQLPVKLKDVLILRSIEEFSQAEAGQILEISEKAVETRLYRARIKLSEILRD